MKVKELIEMLQECSDDAEVCFYDCMRGDDMYFRDISVSYNEDKIYLNIR